MRGAHAAGIAWARAVLGAIPLFFWLGCDAAQAPVPEDPAGAGAASEPLVPAAPEPVAYVGAAACAGCHPEESASWRGSHHDRAMETPQAVLAPFDGEQFEQGGVRARFERVGDALRVVTEDEAGGEAAFDVAYGFGVAPLQQLLLPLSRGRLQAFRVAWDTRPAEAGGQRWLLLQPEEPGPVGDVMHWTGFANSWNSQCVDCHSTAVRRGFDVAERRFETTFAEIDVGCEACHGPASRHVAAAQEGRGAEVPPPRSLRDPRRWVLGPGDSIAHREPARASDEALDVCAPCHSRRAPLTATTNPTRAFLDGYRPQLLDAGLYHADGQILDEVYVWGSFVQSRMYAAGVRCGDCHDPHSASLASPESPDAVCASCHRGETFQSREHHGHTPDGAGASCVGCHMPSRTYMEIDARRDHSFRVPRPDLALEIGTPDACTGCHVDRDAAWAAREAARLWPGLAHRPEFGRALHAGRTRAADAPARLQALLADDAQPAIARATALRLLGDVPTRELPEAVAAGARSAEPLIRMAAVDAARSLPPQLRLDALPGLLDDARAIRIEAARELWLAREGLDAERARRLEHVLNEWMAARRANADQPGSHVALGNLYRIQGRTEEARAAFEEGLRLAPWFAPAAVNLADLLREQGQDEEAVDVLEAAIARVPDSADMHHALGLAHVRRGDVEAGIAALARAAELAPQAARYTWVLAVAQRDAGRSEEATRLLREASARIPGDRTLLATLAEWAMQDGDAELATEAARGLLARDPADPLGLAVQGAIPSAEAGKASATRE